MMRIRQAGFTLIELMIGSAAAMIIFVPATMLMLQTTRWYGDIQSLLAINRHARITMGVLINGAEAAVPGNDGTKHLYGLDGFNALPNSVSYQQASAFTYTSNGLTIKPDILGAVGSNNNVKGWVPSDPTIDTKRNIIAGRTEQFTLDITDPFEKLRDTTAAHATVTYKLAATRVRDEVDP
jgi:prepilin-type N-terminal cleavage/methylation domain-containing protein